MKTQNSAALAVRIRPANPDHHLWNNHGTFWAHFTVHLPDYSKARIRRSLGTSVLSEARRRRDAFLDSMRRNLNPVLA
jgi:hypothetical protein